MKKFLISLLMAFSLIAPAQAVTSNFTADTTSALNANPERAWYLLAGDLGSTSSFDANLVAIRDSFGFRLALADSVLPNSGAIPGATLTAYTASFAAARARGMKLIVRFVYGSSISDPAITLIESQAAQLAPILKANSDVIHVVQAGFIGAYGEWADSANGNDLKVNKRRVKDAVLAMVPTEIPVNFTQLYPPMEDWFGSGQAPASPLAASEAFTASPKARSGFHGDCFLTGNGDSFTYTGPSQVQDFVITSSRALQRAYAATASEYVPWGGETCNNSQGAGVQQRVQCDGSLVSPAITDEIGQTGGILNEGPRYHLNYLNNSFAPNFVTEWQASFNATTRPANPCYGTITNKMGYRFQFDSITHNATVTRGTTIVFDVAMRNVGWSRIFSQRRLHVIVKPLTGSDIDCASATQLRQLHSQSSNSETVRVSCAIPAGAATGNATVFLQMPDDHASISATRAYMIQPANANNGSQTWDNTLGRFQTSAAGTLVIN